MRSRIILATRASKLALAQANLVKNQIEKHWQDLEVKVFPIKTSGDLILDRPLREAGGKPRGFWARSKFGEFAESGGKGLFVKEIEEALLKKKADIAVHSMKDVPSIIPEGLKIGAMLKREDPRDLLVKGEGYLVKGEGKKIVGTSSLRRKVQLLRMRSNLIVKDLRGNIDTRLRKLGKGEFDAIILAQAGMQRLKLSLRNCEFLPFIPAAGQGAIGIEQRIEEQEIEELLQPLHCSTTALCVNAERILSKKLEGECELPLGAYAEVTGDKLKLKAFLANPDGKKFIQDEVVGDAVLAEELAEKLVEILFAKGAEEILREIRKL